MMTTMTNYDKAAAYDAFLHTKIPVSPAVGFAIDPDELHPSLTPLQRVAVPWALRLGRALLGMKFGLGKTRCQLEIARFVHRETGGRFLFVCPLGVRHVFIDEEGPEMGMALQYVATDEEVLAAETPFLVTNYERIQSGDISPEHFTGMSLDEGSVLSTMGASTSQVLRERWKPVVAYRFIATATPDRNRYLELLSYADFVEAMDAGQARTRWFKRNSTKAHDLQLHSHLEADFWHWVSTWALFVDKPSDLGFSDEGYELPPLNVHWHRIDVDHRRAWEQTDRNGQHRLLLDAAAGVTEASKEKRATMDDRITKMVEIYQEKPDAHWLFWHHLEDERKAITRAVPAAVAVYGSQPLEKKEELILGFSRGQFPILATKPEIAGSGCNFQKHCADNIFLGVNYQFEDFLQAIYRTHRYGQWRPVNIHIIYAASEDMIVQTLKRKWRQYEYRGQQMSAIMQKYGLSRSAIEQALSRSIGVTRMVEEGDRFTASNNDCVLETMQMEDESVGMILTSIPFGDQYEYVASYNDFGHNDDNEAFFEQMDFLIPELLRVLKPGRICAIHCKDRARVGRYSKHGVFSMDPFSDEVARRFRQHGFIQLARITITTDVVRENNQTYRLGWSEMLKDGSKMGVGMPEYIQVFRKLPSDRSNAYADEPVTKERADYSLGRWQVDAHQYWRSNGNRLLRPEEVAALDIKAARRLVVAEQQNGHYDYERHVAICEALDEAHKLPRTFNLIPAQSNSEFVWSDVVYARTLNTSQSQKRQQHHVCPLPLDIVERCLERWSNEDDLVYDPFAGLFTVPYLAVTLKRRGYGCELNSDYWATGVGYCRDAETQAMTPTLFDWLEELVEVAV
jgi:DNA modification methylase